MGWNSCKEQNMVDENHCVEVRSRIHPSRNMRCVEIVGAPVTMRELYSTRWSIFGQEFLKEKKFREETTSFGDTKFAAGRPTNVSRAVFICE
ncbi:hypothetical protein LOAG_03701 [Loa loa]|uniref:Uncharacterized protein n=1 Tax=Loa loa TaxID=7209 RepID=A0A1S0U5L3_LOALO|nr:hypothetical protein LOAG_03701 [Loa loa]EFO24788.1 hypothetical protein LOAG_03701 [Loa loa]